MKIAILGYGKMGMAIEKMAIEQGHDIILTIGSQNIHDLTIKSLSNADVAIEFSTPDTAFDNIKTCIDAGIPVVSGTTAWLDQYDEIKEYCIQNKGAFLYSSNFSIGVNIFFKLNKWLAEMMSDYSEYKPSITEIHHTHKLDAPSGTAITLADGLIENNTQIKSWVKGKSTDDQTIGIQSERIDPAPGTHSIHYSSAIDDIEIKHTAHSRDGFVKGALTAAKWLIGKKGVFGMGDVLG